MATETWVLELGGVRVEEEASVKEKDGSVPLYKGCEYQTSPPGPQNLPIPKELYPNDGWVTHVRVSKESLDEGTRSLLRQDVPMATASRNVERQTENGSKL